MKKSKKPWARLMAVLSLIVLCVVGVAVHQVASANDAEVNTLKVKTQLKANSADTSKKDIRLLTAIDDYKNYQYVGFEIKVTGTDINKEWNKTETKAWTSMLENGQSVSPSAIFGDGANYFVAHSITGIPESAWNATWVVRPYGVTLAGDTIYGTERQFSIRSTIDNLAEGSLSGKITFPVATTEEAVITLMNSAGTTTYQTTATDGSYTLNVPQDTYQMTIKHSGFADNYVEAVQVGEQAEQNVSMRKNINYSVSSAITDEGYCYIKSGENARFANGCGTAWKTELEMPLLNNYQAVGFSLIANNGTDAIWGQWMKIALCNIDGNLQVETWLHIDNEFEVAEVTKANVVSAAEAEGQMLQLVLTNGALTLKLGETELAVYDSSYEITKDDSTGTISKVLDITGTNGVDCGLMSYNGDCNIQDWCFTNIYNPDVKRTVSGVIGAPLNGVNLEQVVVQLTSEDGTTYSQKSIPDASGNYEFNDVPEGKYKLTATHSAYVDNAMDISVIYGDVVKNLLLRKNISSNFTTTDDGYCQSTAWTNGRFVDGCGTAWKAEFEMPALPNYNGIGFVLHASNGTDTIWGQWMQVALVNVNGTLQVETWMNKDDTFKVAEVTKVLDITADVATDQMVQLVLNNGTLTLKLGEEELVVYDSSYSITDTDRNTGVANTVGTITESLDISGTNGLYCGLFSYNNGITIKDWSFMQMNTISGKVTSPISDDVSDVTLKFENAFGTYLTSPDEDRMYSVQVLCGDYYLTGSHSAFVDNTAEVDVSTGDVNFDIQLRKNISSNFTTTDDGYCQSTAWTNGRFVDGYGTAWKAEFEMPALPNYNGIGFVLHASNGTDTIWGQWMQVALVNVNGTLQVETWMNKDDTFKVAEVTKVLDITADTATGQMLQLVLNNGTLTLKLGEEELVVYDSSYSITDTDRNTGVANTVGTITESLDISGTNGVYCGLFSYNNGITIKDWVFEKNFF